MDVRRTAKNALALQAEVTRLEKLLSEASIEPARRRPITRADKESRRLRATLERVEHRKATIDALRMERGELRKEVTRLSRELDRLSKRLAREEQASERHKETIRQQFDRDIELRATLRRLHDQSDAVRSLSNEVFRLGFALGVAKAGKAAMKAKLAKLLTEKKTRSGTIAGPQLRAALRRSRRQKQTIKAQSREIAPAAQEREGVADPDREAGNASMPGSVRARPVLQKALFGNRSKQQQKPRSERKRGQQPGAPGHGRTQRPALEEKTEHRNPPKNARRCSCCGTPYVMNGERSSTIIEIAVKAHTRRIVRPRWRRSCGCSSSPLEVTAPPGAETVPPGRPTEPACGRVSCSNATLVCDPCTESPHGCRTRGCRSPSGRWPTACPASCRCSSRSTRRSARARSRRRCAMATRPAGASSR